MITVLHSESSMGWGGQEKRTVRELVGLSPNRFRPLLVCRPGSKIGQEAQSRGIVVEWVKMRGNFDPWAVFQLMNLIQRHRVDIVHTHSSADSWMSSVAAKLSPRRPWVVRTRHLSCSIRNRLIYRWMADRVITVGESTRKYMVHEKGIPKDKIITIPTGVDLEKFNPRRVKKDFRNEMAIPANAPVLGTVAVFRRLKGHVYILRAMKEILSFYPDAKLLLVGEGPQEENLRRTMEELGVGKAVILPGYREDVERLLQAMDVFVFPSLQEALGTAIIEAMAMEKPVVASRVGGIPEIVEDGKTGFLVNPEDVQGIAERVLFLFGNPALAESMGKAGRRVVEEHFDTRQMVERIEKLYEWLLAERKP